MKWSHIPAPTRLRVIAAAILLIGCASSILIYLTARAAPDNPLGNGLENSKQYLREVEVYGGTANVLASEIRQWFNELWHGKRLAFTIEFMSLAVALFLLFVAGRLPIDGDREASSASDQGASDS